MMSFIKKCSECKIEKSSEEFNKHRTRKDGLQSVCKLCSLKNSSKWRAENKERHKELCRKWQAENKERAKEADTKWRAKNKERVKKTSAKWYIENKERQKETNAKWRAENKEREKERRARYYQENKEREKEKAAKWRAENKHRQKELSRKWSAENREKITKQVMQRYYSDPNFRLVNVLRARVRGAIKNGHKSAKTMELLGCSIEEVKSHLESQFTEGMTWDNYGKWHIDHIIPCASFDLTDPEQQKKCFHYTNLQPLWATENISKGAKLEYQIERD